MSLPRDRPPSWDPEDTDVYEHLRGRELDQVGEELGVFRGGDDDGAYLVRVRSAARR